MKTLLAALTLAAVSLSAHAAENNSFISITKGKTIGKASYTIDKVKEGLRVRSRYEFHVHAKDINSADEPPAQGRGNPTGTIDGQFNAEYKISPDGVFLGGYLQDGTTQSMISFTPSKARDSFSVSVTQGGAVGEPRIMPTPKPAYTFVPNFEPGGIQALLMTATAHPHDDKTYLLLVPGNTARQTPSMEYVAFDPAQATSASGTLDGKPVELKHYTLRFHSGDADVYTDTNGNLMEADMNPMSTKYVRVKFALDEKK